MSFWVVVMLDCRLFSSCLLKLRPLRASMYWSCRVASCCSLVFLFFWASFFSDSHCRASIVSFHSATVFSRCLNSSFSTIALASLYASFASISFCVSSFSLFIQSIFVVLDFLVSSNFCDSVVRDFIVSSLV